MNYCLERKVKKRRKRNESPHAHVAETQNIRLGCMHDKINAYFIFVPKWVLTIEKHYYLNKT